MKFKFIGTQYSEVFGLQWRPGDTHDVTDAHAIGKLTTHPMFQAVTAAAHSSHAHPQHHTKQHHGEKK